MSQVDFHLLVDRAYVLQARIASDEAELKQLEEKILAKCLASSDEHTRLEDPEREGTQYLAHGEAVSVPVVMTADALVKSFQSQSALHHSISKVAGAAFTALFRPVSAWKATHDDGKKFRAAVRELCGDRAPQVITACLQRDRDGQPKSVTKIEWDRAKPRRVEA